MRTLSFPDQTGQAGKFLQTNGTNVLWATGGGGTGVVEAVVAGTGISVDSTDPANPIVSLSTSVPSGTGAANQVTFWSGVSTVTGSNDFTWDNTTKALTLLSGGSTTMVVSPSTGIYGIGDVDVAANGSAMFISDLSSLAILTGGLQQLMLDDGNDRTFLGLVGAGGNATYLNIDTSTAPGTFKFLFGEGLGTVSPLIVGKDTLQLLPFGTSAGNTYEQRFYELTAGGSNYSGFKSSDARGTSITYVLPSTDPTAGQVLSATAPSGGISTLSWRSTVDGSGAATQVAYFTDTDTLASSPDFAWDNTNAQLLLGDGSVTNPSYSFLGITSMGLYRSGNTMRYARDGIERIRFGTDGRIAVGANATGLMAANGLFHGTYDADPQDQDGIIVIDTYSDEGWTTTIGGRRARGTAAAPTELLAGDKLVEFIGKGWDGHGDFTPSNRALVGMYANEDWTSSSNNGTYITINTTTDGTGANHTSLLIDDEGNFAVTTANSAITTTSFPTAWSSTNAKHMVIRSGGANRDIGLFMQTSDNSAGMEMWYDGSTGVFSFDSMTDNSGASMVFNLRTLGTPVPVLTLATTGVVLSAGTTTFTPLKYTSGTLNTTAVAGGHEYDGKVFYSTPVASARGVSPSVQFSMLSGNFTLANASGVQSAFPTSQDVFTLQASTSYFFEGIYFLSTGTTSHSLGMAFNLGGGASVTSINYVATAWKGAANTTATAQGTTRIDRVASTVVLAASAATDGAVYFSGVIRMNAGGTVTPQIAFSADPTGTCLMLTDSFIRFTPIGTNTVTLVGNVA
jgi:hypothetical protein